MIGAGNRRAAIGLLVLIIIGMGMETLSVGMVIPVLAMLADDAPVNSIGLFASVQEYALNLGDETSILFMGALLAVTFIVRGIIVIVISWIREKFIAELRSSTSRKLFSSYLAQDYSYHLGKNSSTMIRNVITEATKFSSLLNQGFIFISDLLLIFAIFGLIFYISPLEALSTIILFGIAWIVFFCIVGKSMDRWGEVRQISDGFRLQHVQQGLGALKEVKLLGREKEFISLYQPYNQTSAQMAQYKSFVKIIPRILFEIIAVLAILVIIFFQPFVDQSSVGLIPKLGLFAVAAVRILPSINRLASVYNSLKFGRAVIDIVYRDIILSAKYVQKPRTLDKLKFRFEKDIKLKGIFFRYAESDRDVLSNISLKIKKGEMIGLVGKSGSGKSTLVDLLIGLLEPGSGKVLIDNIDIQKDLRSWQGRIGYVPQSVYLCDDTLAKNVAFGLPDDDIDEDRIYRVIEEANLSPLVSSSALGIQMPLGENGAKLSGGQRQRIGLARALYNNPDLLVLDEATSALDYKTEKQIVQTLESMRGIKTILIISHRQSTLVSCDRVFTLSNGMLLEPEDQKKIKEG